MMAKCVVLTAVAMLAVACVASPLSKDTTATTKATERLPERPPETPGRLENRVRRSVQISEDQRELMSRQLLQALSEIIQREDCVTDYQGWVDFGRRSTD
ncbi:Gastrin/cholecystokinin-like peptide [Labeo rohita]|uniref:Gastrin/cholecystokinin-like peptide n=1 Tax=Labeo rohita TaxID=84645 RepID=A0ABQ8M933_LABRO|nr:gastrin/cholecystokinin-like peptide [Labeo rohita]KAI2659390.1 Gastrin/cholecystokinin-like peptide [Labeo rohita]